MNPNQNIKTANWLIVIAGMWLVISPFLLGYGGTLLGMSDIIAGIVISFLSLVAIGLPEESRWMNWVSAILGVWIFITPLFIASFGNAGLWNNLIVGVMTITLGVWGATSLPYSSSSQQPKAA